MSKIYVFIYKKTGKVYAYTTHKTYAKDFKKQRNMKLFKYLKVDDDDTLHGESLPLNDYNELTGGTDGFYLYDGFHIYNMVVTYGEMDSVIDESNYILCTMIDLKKNLKTLIEKEGVNIPEDELKIIYSLTNFLNNEEVHLYFDNEFDDGYIHEYVNTFKVFFKLFGYTMYKKLKPVLE